MRQSDEWINSSLPKYLRADHFYAKDKIGVFIKNQHEIFSQIQWQINTGTCNHVFNGDSLGLDYGV